MPKFGQAEFAEFLVEMFMKNKLDKILESTPILIFTALSTFSIISNPTEPTYLSNRFRSIVRICSARTIEFLGNNFEPQMWICVGRNGFFAADKGSTTSVGLYLLPTLFCTTITGLIPPCSEPIIGSRSA